MLKLSNVSKNFFKRGKAFVLALTCAFSTITFSSCKSNNDYENEEDSSYYVNSEVSKEESQTNSYNFSSSQSSNKQESDYSQINENEYSFNKLVHIDSSINQYIQNYIDSIETNYPYSDFYNVDQALDKYYTIYEYDSVSTGLINNNYVDSNKLYNKVLNNNKIYLDNHESNIYASLSNEQVMIACNIIADNINGKLSINNIDINELDDKLYNLKILKYSSFGYGLYSSDTGIMGLNINSINSLSYKSDVFESVVRHESNHIIQANSILEKEKEGYNTKFGPSYSWDDLEVNSLYWNWYFEGSAESLNVNDYNKESLTYPNELKCLDTIKVATILNNNNNIYDLENLSLQSDLENLFDYFDCKSNNDKEEIIKMFYAFNIIYRSDSDSSSTDFINKYKQEYGNLDLNSYSNSLKGSISLTLSKQFYRNLFNEITEKDVDLDNILKIICVYENEISRFTWYSSKYSDLNDFLDKYVKLQDEVFQTLADKTNLSLDEIRDIYENYNKNLNNNINWLTSDKNDFYNYITSTRKNDKKDSIYNVYIKNYGYTKKLS